MKEAKPYHVCSTGLAEGEKLGHITVYLKSDFEVLQEEIESLQHWRDLALQFDNHRMTALWHLKTIVSDPKSVSGAKAFLSAPPLAAHEVLDKLSATEQRNLELVELLRDIYNQNELSLFDDQRILAMIDPQSDEFGAV